MNEGDRMKINFAAAISVLALSSVFTLATAAADPIDLSTYTINFAGGTTFPNVGTVAPTAGSFTYDADTTTFTAFSVIWDGFTFNLAGAANNPQFPHGPPTLLACLTGLTGGAATFALLTTCVPPPSSSNCVPFWQGQTNPGPNTFAGFEFGLVCPGETLIDFGVVVFRWDRADDIYCGRQLFSWLCGDTGANDARHARPRSIRSCVDATTQVGLTALLTTRPALSSPPYLEGDEHVEND